MFRHPFFFVALSLLNYYQTAPPTGEKRMSEAAPKAKKQDTDPDAFMTQAREALQQQREGALAKLQAAQDELDAITDKLARIEAYFSPPATREPEPKTRKPRQTTGTRRPRQSGVRDNVLAKIKEYPDGIKAAALIEAMGGKDNKPVETSVRNAVNALKKASQITSEGGVYRAV